MRNKIQGTFFLITTVILSLVFTSCPLPITEAVVAAVEDSYAPSVSVTSHIRNDYYYSSLTIEGYIGDDALVPGDDKGQLSSLSFYADNDTNYRGGILIDSSGNPTQDLTKGAVLIDYPGDGTFSFTMDTSGLNDDIEIEFFAVDLNSNSSPPYTLRLKNSSGPRVVLDSPADGEYFGDTSTIVLTGSISDSTTILDSIAEIAFVRFSISPLGLDVEMDIDSLVDEDPSDGTLYNLPIDFLAPAKFTLDDTAFSCTFRPPDSGMNTTTTLTVEAEDRNGNRRSSDATMYFASGGPLVNISLPLKGGTYHSSDLTEATFPLTFSVQETGLNLKEVYYEIAVGSGGYSSKKSLYGPIAEPVPADEPLNETHSFSDEINPDLFNDDFTIRVTAVAADGQESYPRPTRTIYNDTDGPDIIGFSFDSSVENPAYAAHGETVNMSFSLSDTGVGLDDSGLELWIEDFGNIIDLTSQNPGPYSVDLNLPDVTEPGYSGGPIPFRLRAVDGLSNESILTEATNSLIYYHDAPISGNVDFLNETQPADTEYLIAGETLQISLPTDRHLDIGAFDFKLYFDGGSTQTLDYNDSYTYHSEITESSENGPISYTWNYEDMAGNEATFTDVATGFSIDRTLPVLSPFLIESDNSDDNTIAIDGSTVTVSATCTDGSGSGIDGTPTLQFRIETSPGVYSFVTPDMGTTTFNPGTGVISAELSISGTTPQGTMTAVITMNDVAGNSNPAVGTTAVLVDSVSPEITINDFHNGTGDTNAGIGDTLTLEFIISESASDTKPPVVTFTVGGETLQATETANPGTDRKEWTATYSVVEAGTVLEGAVSADVEVWDDVDNSDSDTETGVTIDNVRPVIAVGTFNAGTSDDIKAGIGETLTLSFTLTESAPIGLDPQVTFTDGSEILDAVESVVDGPTRKTWTAEYLIVEEGSGGEPELLGSFTASVNTWDDFGNLGQGNTGADSVSVDNVKPSISLLEINTSPPYTAGTDVSVTATVSEHPASVAFSCESSTGDSSTNLSQEADATITLPSSTGTYEIDAIATDDHGNIGSSASIDVVVE